MKKLKENKALQIIFKVLETIVFIIIGLYLLLLVFQKVTGNKSLLGFRVFTVASNSMEPVFVVNDVIVVKDIDYEDIKVNDIITYQGLKGDMKGRIITHRVIEKNGDTLTLKGDANTGIDPEINSSQVYGKAVYKTVFLSLINKIIKTKFGFFFLIFVPLVIVVFLEVVDMFDGKKKES